MQLYKIVTVTEEWNALLEQEQQLFFFCQLQGQAAWFPEIVETLAGQRKRYQGAFI